MEYPLAVYVTPKTIMGFRLVAADPQLRSKALEVARAQRAPRRYRALVKAFAAYDIASGVNPAFVDSFIRNKLATAPKSQGRAGNYAPSPAT